MEDKLERIENKIDKIVEDISEIKTITAKQQVSLDYHIKRTDLLEEKLEPVESHVKLISAFFKIIGGIAVIAGIVSVIIQVLSYANK